MMNCKIPCNSTALLPPTTPLKFAFNQTAESLFHTFAQRER